MRKQILTYLSVLLLVNACKKDAVISSVDVGHGYFPISAGSIWVYEVDSIFMSGVDTNRTLFEEKIVVDSLYLNASKDSVFQVQKYRNGSIFKVYTITKNPRRIEQTENNTEIKMIFPITEGEFWNIHSFSNLDEIEVGYQEVGSPFSKGVFSYDKTCSVVLEDPEVVIDEIRSLEVYADNIGLVYVDLINMDKQSKTGTQVIKKLKDYYKP